MPGPQANYGGSYAPNFAGNSDGSVLGALTGVGGYLIAGNQANDAATQAASGAQYGPTSISGPLGNLGATVGPGGSLNYNYSGGPLSAPSATFGNLANAYGSAGLLGAGNPIGNLPGQVTNALAGSNQAYGLSAPNFFTPMGQQGFQGLAGNAQQLANISNQAGAGQLGQMGGFNQVANSALGSLGGFSLPSATSNAYGQLAALTAPTNTANTQAMLNYEQASGRGGLNQNGVLGDMGGLALAQSLGATNNALQANQLAQSEGNYYGNLATGLSGAGLNAGLGGLNLAGAGNSLAQNSDQFGYNRLVQQNLLAQQNAQNIFNNANASLAAGEGLNTSNVNNALGASGGNVGIQGALTGQLNSSIYGSGARANAGNNAGYYTNLAGINNAASTGALFGGLGSALSQASTNPTLGGLASGVGNFFGFGGGSPSYTTYGGSGVDPTLAYNQGSAAAGIGNYTPSTNYNVDLSGLAPGNS